MPDNVKKIETTYMKAGALQEGRCMNGEHAWFVSVMRLRGHGQCCQQVETSSMIYGGQCVQDGVSMSKGAAVTNDPCK